MDDGAWSIAWTEHGSVGCSVSSPSRFIKNDAGGKDDFLHVKSLGHINLDALKDDVSRQSYEIESKGNGKSMGVDVDLIDWGAPCGDAKNQSSTRLTNSSNRLTAQSTRHWRPAAPGSLADVLSRALPIYNSVRRWLGIRISDRNMSTDTGGRYNDRVSDRFYFRRRRADVYRGADGTEAQPRA
jgi:hypothetical protein